MNLDAREARIFPHRGVTSEGNSTTAAHENGIPAFVGRGIESECFPGESRRNEGLHDPQWRERVLPTRFEKDRNLEHRGGKPERINRRGITGKRDSECFRYRVIVHLQVIKGGKAPVKKLKGKVPGQPSDHSPDLGHGRVDLPHVHAAEGVRQLRQC